jgi:hypothetical protein
MLTMPNFASQLSLGQLKHLACKSVARVSKRCGIEFMTDAIDAVETELSVDQRRRLVEAPGQSVLASELVELVHLIKSVFDPYRPELHYMRGPGPKWHAKHCRAATESHDAPGLLRVKAWQPKRHAA